MGQRRGPDDPRGTGLLPDQRRRVHARRGAEPVRTFTLSRVALAAQPERPFAWILKPVQPSLTPGGELNPEAPILERYEVVQIFATELWNDQVWYLIGPHRWIDQTYVARSRLRLAQRVWTRKPPGRSEPLRANAGRLPRRSDGLRDAGLSGLRGWDTPPDLSQVWLRVESGKMSGGYNRPDYYFLEDVPWTQYFNRDVALHTAYWHDGFGYRVATVASIWLRWTPSGSSIGRLKACGYGCTPVNRNNGATSSGHTKSSFSFPERCTRWNLSCGCSVFRMTDIVRQLS